MSQLANARCNPVHERRFDPGLYGTGHPACLRTQAPESPISRNDLHVPLRLVAGKAKKALSRQRMPRVRRMTSG
jgi:hypothetical protein